jgi:serine/threonine protein kinase
MPLLINRLPSFSNKKRVNPTFLRKSTSSIDTSVTYKASQLSNSLSSSFSIEDFSSNDSSFIYSEDASALSWWEPVHLLGQGSISDIHLVRRRKKFQKIKPEDNHNIMGVSERKKSWTMRSNDVKSDELYVLKSISKSYIGDEQVFQEMRSEILTLSKLNHPNICGVIEAYSMHRQIYLVMEFCSGGNLSDRIPMRESEATKVTQKIIQAVDYLHDSGITQRDIKLENIIFTDKGEIKLIDFGLAAEFRNCTLYDKVGTLYSMAPEVPAESYDHRCDIWSIGVVTYLLLSGKQPFWGREEKTLPWRERRLEMIALIEKCEFSPMSTGAWLNVSTSANAFVRSLLQLNADDRPTLEQALNSEWIRSS